MLPFILHRVQWLFLCSSGKNRGLQIKAKHGSKQKAAKMTERTKSAKTKDGKVCFLQDSHFGMFWGLIQKREASGTCRTLIPTLSAWMWGYRKPRPSLSRLSQTFNAPWIFIAI